MAKWIQDDRGSSGPHVQLLGNALQSSIIGTPWNHLEPAAVTGHNVVTASVTLQTIHLAQVIEDPTWVTSYPHALSSFQLLPAASFGPCLRRQDQFTAVALALQLDHYTLEGQLVAVQHPMVGTIFWHGKPPKILFACLEKTQNRGLLQLVDIKDVGLTQLVKLGINICYPT